jgi:type VI protein secretion system component Hcp
MQKGTTSGVSIGKCGPGCRDLKVVALWAPRQSFENRIDVLAWSWGMSNNGSAHIGGGAGAGKVSVQDLAFSKFVDGRMTENVTLNFANVSVDYTPKNAKGGAETPIAIGWDIAANARES